MGPHLLVAQAVTRSLAADGVQVPAKAVAHAANAALDAVAEWERIEAARYDRDSGLGGDAA